MASPIDAGLSVLQTQLGFQNMVNSNDPATQLNELAQMAAGFANLVNNPIAAAATNAGAALVTIAKMELDAREGKSPSVGDVLSLAGNVISIAAAFTITFTPAGKAAGILAKVAIGIGMGQVLTGGINAAVASETNRAAAFTPRVDPLTLGLSGNDALDGSAGDDILEGGLGDDLIGGNSGSDLIYGGAGRDGLGDDLIGGNSGSDLIYGGAGRDMILSATGLNAPPRDVNRDGIFEDWAPPAGAGAVWTQGRTWGIYASVDANGEVYIVDGGGSTGQDSAGDIVFAGDDDDRVVGGLGDDYLDGGLANDNLPGHGGNDDLEGSDIIQAYLTHQQNKSSNQWLARAYN